MEAILGVGDKIISHCVFTDKITVEWENIFSSVEVTDGIVVREDVSVT